MSAGERVSPAELREAAKMLEMGAHRNAQMSGDLPHICAYSEPCRLAERLRGEAEFREGVADRLHALAREEAEFRKNAAAVIRSTREVTK